MSADIAPAVTTTVTPPASEATYAELNHEASSVAQPPSTSASAEKSPPSSSAAPAPPAKDGAIWVPLSADHPLQVLNQKVPDLVAQASHSEVYGIDLGESASPSFARNLVLQKFLRANQGDVEKASQQLLETLKWRREFDPRGAVQEVFSGNKFGGLGYVTKLARVKGSTKPEDVATFNIYGAVKESKETFGDTEAFLRWRVALMEMSIAALHLDSVTEPIPDYGQGPDPHQGLQIHDYLGVSFWRQDPLVKAASKEAIATFTKYYPETLSRKFMVNVPTVMGWVFTAMKIFMPAATIKKITIVTDGKTLVDEIGEGVPEAYGGKGSALEQGESPKTD